METANDIITDALADAQVLAEGIPITSDMLTRGMRTMNRFVNALASDGISLGYTNVTSGGDNVTVSEGAYDPLVTLLTKRFCIQYARPVPPEVERNVVSSLETLRAIGVPRITGNYPSTLPFGSGNDYDQTNIFFPDEEGSILGEDNGYIAAE